ncbi:aldo/keto reductase [Synechococcus sp. MU1617]|uniref:aldo/keto reductase n=1 Tax=Synechococcus sp. MU1617 TaxID=2508346 RepID=UPI001CF863BB|nr:aldo/keto reductase [Synechococcus sp. MU1617]MCB4389475.1 aldo/keto reductase [Synechococcus sp. MU1617]
MSMVEPKLCLGTAQFGQNYGITNQESAINEDEAYKLLQIAAKHEINHVDTALCYGRSQEIIGNIKKDIELHITSKIKINDGNEKVSDIRAKWDIDLNNTLESLKINKLDTLLIHDTGDASPEKIKAFSRWIEKQKESNRLNRAGVSIYDGKEIDRIPRELLEVVQLPMSIYDQRVIDNGTIEKLIQTGSSIQIRSIFMQGLLLQPEKRWPGWIDETTKSHHKKYVSQIESLGSSLLDQAVTFAKMQNYAESVLIGVSTVKDFEEIIKAWQKDIELEKVVTYETWKVKDSRIVDPRNWPK